MSHLSWRLADSASASFFFYVSIIGVAGEVYGVKSSRETFAGFHLISMANGWLNATAQAEAAAAAAAAIVQLATADAQQG